MLFEARKSREFITDLNDRVPAGGPISAFYPLFPGWVGSYHILVRLEKEAIFTIVYYRHILV